MRAVTYKEIEDFWLSKMEDDDIYSRTLLYRYVTHYQSRRKLQTELNRMGVLDKVENKHQKYTNPNKILKEIRDIDKEMREIETSLGTLLEEPATTNEVVRKPLL